MAIQTQVDFTRYFDEWTMAFATEADITATNPTDSTDTTTIPGGYHAGVIVRHSNRLWLCQTTGTEEEPGMGSDNTNWLEIQTGADSDGVDEVNFITLQANIARANLPLQAGDLPAQTAGFNQSGEAVQATSSSSITWRPNQPTSAIASGEVRVIIHNIVQREGTTWTAQGPWNADIIPAVSTDDTLTGDGGANGPLSVANPTPSWVPNTDPEYLDQTEGDARYRQSSVEITHTDIVGGSAASANQYLNGAGQWTTPTSTGSGTSVEIRRDGTDAGIGDLTAVNRILNNGRFLTQFQGSSGTLSADLEQASLTLITGTNAPSNIEFRVSGSTIIVGGPQRAVVGDEVTITHSGTTVYTGTVIGVSDSGFTYTMDSTVTLGSNTGTFGFLFIRARTRRIVDNNGNVQTDLPLFRLNGATYTTQGDTLVGTITIPESDGVTRDEATRIADTEATRIVRENAVIPDVDVTDTVENTHAIAVNNDTNANLNFNIEGFNDVAAGIRVLSFATQADAVAFYNFVNDDATNPNITAAQWDVATNTFPPNIAQNRTFEFSFTRHSDDVQVDGVTGDIISAGIHSNATLRFLTIGRPTDSGAAYSTTNYFVTWHDAEGDALTLGNTLIAGPTTRSTATFDFNAIANQLQGTNHQLELFIHTLASSPNGDINHYVNAGASVARTATALADAAETALGNDHFIIGRFEIERIGNDIAITSLDQRLYPITNIQLRWDNNGGDRRVLTYGSRLVSFPNSVTPATIFGDNQHQHLYSEPTSDGVIYYDGIFVESQSRIGFTVDEANGFTQTTWQTGNVLNITENPTITNGMITGTNTDNHLHVRTVSRLRTNLGRGSDIGYGVNGERGFVVTAEMEEAAAEYSIGPINATTGVRELTGAHFWLPSVATMPGSTQGNVIFRAFVPPITGAPTAINNTFAEGDSSTEDYYIWYPLSERDTIDNDIVPALADIFNNQQRDGSNVSVDRLIIGQLAQMDTPANRAIISDTSRWSIRSRTFGSTVGDYLVFRAGTSGIVLNSPNLGDTNIEFHLAVHVPQFYYFVRQANANDPRTSMTSTLRGGRAYLTTLREVQVGTHFDLTYGGITVDIGNLIGGTGGNPLITADINQSNKPTARGFYAVAAGDFFNFLQSTGNVGTYDRAYRRDDVVGLTGTDSLFVNHGPANNTYEYETGMGGGSGFSSTTPSGTVYTFQSLSGGFMRIDPNGDAADAAIFAEGRMVRGATSGATATYGTGGVQSGDFIAVTTSSGAFQSGETLEFQSAGGTATRTPTNSVISLAAATSVGSTTNGDPARLDETQLRAMLEITGPGYNNGNTLVDSSGDEIFVRFSVATNEAGANTAGNYVEAYARVVGVGGRTGSFRTNQGLLEYVLVSVGSGTATTPVAGLTGAASRMQRVLTVPTAGQSQTLTGPVNLIFDPAANNGTGAYSKHENTGTVT